VTAQVIYVALGIGRIAAARRHAVRLAAGGADVTLVVPDLPDWGGLDGHPRLTIHRVRSARPRSRQRQARRLLRASTRPLSRADLLVAGDAQSFAVAWWAVRRRPDLTVAFEPETDPGRRPAHADLAVVTPWFPGPQDPFAGAFVRSTIDAVRTDFARISILHTETWYYPPTSLLEKLARVAAQRLAPRAAPAVTTDVAEGELTRVAVAGRVRRGYAGRAEAQTEALRAALPGGRIEAPLVHAHAGIYGGLVAARLARPEARIVVSEHASFLPVALDQPPSRRLYQEMLDRIDVLLCVSGYLRDVVRSHFPAYADKLRVVPNPIDFERFPLRPVPPREPLRWLYVGRVTAAKGVFTLLDGFARIAAEDPRVTLTLVGSGPDVPAVRARIAALPCADRVCLRPAVPPDDVAGLMHAHDLLVHASPMETFGLTVVEAIATGLPVLVARSPGPQDTLAGLAGLAGQLFEPGDDPELLAGGFRALRERFGVLDVGVARERLRARYGREAVAEHLRDAYGRKPGPVAAAPADLAVPVAPDPAADRVVLVAVSATRRAREYAQRLLRDGYRVDLITADLAGWNASALGPGARFHLLGAAEERRPARRLERLLLFRAPGKLLALADSAARRFATPWPQVVVEVLRQRQERLARKVHRRLFEPCYRIFRPRVLRRIAEREIAPALDLARTRRIVVAGSTGVTLAWSLGRRRPDVLVTTALTPVTDAASPPRQRIEARADSSTVASS
jgi:glycogen(starch) synthase